MFTFLKNRFISIAVTIVGERIQSTDRYTGERARTCASYPSLNSKLMNEAYFLHKFNEYEKNDSWDQIFHRINIESDSQAKNLSLCCDLSNTFHEKNRYRNVLPYDQNRITLKCVTSENESYINASPLHLPFARRNYILTQGPLPNTASDFWQMVYEQKVSICIMLSKVMEKSFIKCHSYFPSKEDKKLKFDHFECELEHEEAKPNYIIRRIRLIPSDNLKKMDVLPTDLSSSSEESPTTRTIHHFQFTTWPDFGVPEHTDHFLEFLEEVRSARVKLLGHNTNSNSGPPVVCHCSAGIGRTGTFVIVDSVLSMFERKQIQQKEADKGIGQLETSSSSSETDWKVEQQLDSLEALVIFIRRHRMGLIQTPQQLRFCWKTIVDWIKKNGRDKQQSNVPQTEETTSRLIDIEGGQNETDVFGAALEHTYSFPSELAATVTDIRWTAFKEEDNGGSDISATRNPGIISKVENTGNGSTSAVSPKKQPPNSREEESIPCANNTNSSINAANTNVIRARKRSSNERDEISQAVMATTTTSILSNTGPTTNASPRPLSMEQQER